MQRKLIQTEDGSSSLYIPELDEHYHSTHGAVQESMHVFIETGLNTIKKDSLSIFEMGYGTGLNYLLSFLNRKNKSINYYCIEAFPLEKELVAQINYNTHLKLDNEAQQAFQLIHSEESNHQINTHFNLYRQHCKLSDYIAPKPVDLIYFDAFAPDVQPHLWTKDVFDKMFDMLNPEGILTTYCAKGVVRRTMLAAGFNVERLPGPPGKREILRATKPCV